MIFEYISIIIGILKLYIFKLFLFNRLVFEGIPKINSNFHFALRKGTKTLIGNHFKSRNNFNIRNDYSGTIIIGKNCFFNDNVSINCQKKICIGNNVNIGHNVIIIDHDHDYKNDMQNFISEEIKIGNNVWIGANSIILKGSVIPDNSVIAANTVITKKNSQKLKKGSLIYDRRNEIIKEGN